MRSCVRTFSGFVHPVLSARGFSSHGIGSFGLERHDLDTPTVFVRKQVSRLDPSSAISLAYSVIDLAFVESLATSTTGVLSTIEFARL